MERSCCNHKILWTHRSCGAQAPSPATVRLHKHLPALKSKLVSPHCAPILHLLVPQYLRAVQVEFPVPLSRISLAGLGIWDTLPPPSIPISKGLTRFLPMYPHAPMLQTKALTSIHPHFIAHSRLKNTKRNGFPLRILPIFAIAQGPAFCPTEDDGSRLTIIANK